MFFRDATVTVVIKADPALLALLARWLDHSDAAEVARYLYDQMKAIKANLDDNFITPQ